MGGKAAAFSQAGRGRASETGDAVAPGVFPLNSRADGIDAVARMDQVVEMDVRRGKAERAAVPFTGFDQTISNPPVAEYFGSRFRLAGHQGLPRCRGRGFGSQFQHFLDNRNTETEGPSQAGQTCGVPHTTAPETEVEANRDV